MTFPREMPQDDSDQLEFSLHFSSLLSIQILTFNSSLWPACRCLRWAGTGASWWRCWRLVGGNHLRHSKCKSCPLCHRGCVRVWLWACPSVCEYFLRKTKVVSFIFCKPFNCQFRCEYEILRFYLSHSQSVASSISFINIFLVGMHVRHKCMCLIFKAV